MTYEEFKEHVKGKIADYLPSHGKDLEITLTKQCKNNNVMLDAIIILGKEKIAPVIYLEGYYQAYRRGAELDTILQRIADIYIRNERNMGSFSKDDIHYDKIKDHIFVTICNAEMNQKRLEDVPHEIREDIALTYRIEVDLPINEKGNVMINNQQLDLWGIDAEELKEMAWFNMRNHAKPVFSSMSEMINDMCGLETDSDEWPVKLYVLTNEENSFGAAYMFDKNVMGRIAAELGADLVVLPSSVDEVIILKRQEDMDYIALKEMVHEVNCTVVQPEKILSEEVYLYERGAGVISRINMDEQAQGMNMSL